MPNTVLFQWLSPPVETRRFLPISFFRFVERRPYLRGFFITHSKEPVLCYFCLTRVQTSPPQYLSSRQGGTRTHTHEALVPKTSVSAISPLAHVQYRCVLSSLSKHHYYDSFRYFQTLLSCITNLFLKCIPNPENTLKTFIEDCNTHLLSNSAGVLSPVGGHPFIFLTAIASPCVNLAFRIHAQTYPR